MPGGLPGPDLTVTLAVMIGAALVAALAGWWAHRPRVPGRIRWISPVAVQFIALTVLVIMLPHLVGLLSGKPVSGRLFGG